MAGPPVRTLLVSRRDAPTRERTAFAGTPDVWSANLDELVVLERAGLRPELLSGNALTVTTAGDTCDMIALRCTEAAQVVRRPRW